MNVERIRNLLDDPRYTKKKVRLRDGRILSYSECGNIDSGMVALFCFGLMTSSVAIMFAHETALQNNLRLIAVDYPGIGESTYQEGRTLSGWADDMHEFCDNLLGKATKIRLLGHSLGGLHALALLSDRSFKERIIRTVLLSPWIYFPDTESSHSQWIKVAQTLPEFFRDSIIPSLLSNLSSGTLQLVGWSNPHAAQLQSARMVSDYATLQGSAGNEQMVRLALSKSELYIPSNLSSPVTVYHGEKDRLVLMETISKLVNEMNERNCSVDLVIESTADHNSIISDPTNLSRTLRCLVGDSSESWLREIMTSLDAGEKKPSALTPTTGSESSSLRSETEYWDPITSHRSNRSLGRSIAPKLYLETDFSIAENTASEHETETPMYDP